LSVERIAKRDGREVPFDEGKIRSAVARAMAAVGDDDPALPAEVGALVRLALEDRHGAGAPPPHIEAIQDLVERALIELGRAAVAKAYIVYRDRRAQVREALRVESQRPRVCRGAPTVQDSQRSSRWSKARIVAALMGEAELAREVAERVAARVEQRVFGLGLARISTALVRELVDTELAELGLDGALRRQTSVGLPVHDLRRLLAEPVPDLDPARAAPALALCERTLEARISSEVLRRHALLELLPEDALQRHLAGELEIVGLSALQRPLVLALPAEILLASRSVRAHDAYALLDPLASALRAPALGLVLEDAGELVGALAPRARSEGADQALVSWLCALTGAAHAAGRRLDLSGVEGPFPRGARRTVQLMRLCLALDAAPQSAWLPRVFVEESALEALLREGEPGLDETLERLLGAGRLVPTWSGHGERVVGPGCQRHEVERGAIACGSAVALNLPRLALRAGPWREDRLLEGLSDLVASAAEALAAIAELQQRARASALSGLRTRSSYTLVPVGLREALARLGDGEVRPEQGARVLGFLGDHMRRLAARLRLPLALSPFHGERAAERFARLDRESPLAAQQLLFGDPASQAADEPYGCGYRLTPAPGFVPWSAEAELLRTVSPGALHPLPAARGREGPALGESWERFARLRREPFPEVASPRALGPGLFDQLAEREPGEPVRTLRPAARAARSAAEPLPARGTPSDA
jgi:hypothetical protein